MTGGLVLSLILGTVATPQQISGQAFSSVWRIDPTPIASMAFEKGGFTPFQMDTRWVSAQHAVLRASLVTERAVALEAELVTSDGRLRLPIGTRFEVQSSSVMIACAVGKRSSAVWNLFNRGSETTLCLIDSDRDGSFDLSFARKYRAIGYVDVRDRIPSGLQPLGSVRYEAAEQPVFGARPSYSLFFDGYRKGALLFRIETATGFGAGLGVWCASKAIKVPYVSGAHHFQIRGGEFTVTAYDKAANAVAIAVNKSFAPDVIHCGDKD